MRHNLLRINATDLQLAIEQQALSVMLQPKTKCRSGALGFEFQARHMLEFCGMQQLTAALVYFDLDYFNRSTTGQDVRLLMLNLSACVKPIQQNPELQQAKH